MKTVRVLLHIHRDLNTFSTIKFNRCPNLQTELHCLQTYHTQKAAFSVRILKRIEAIRPFPLVLCTKQVTPPKKEVEPKCHTAMFHENRTDLIFPFYMLPCSRSSAKKGKHSR